MNSILLILLWLAGQKVFRFVSNIIKAFGYYTSGCDIHRALQLPHIAESHTVGSPLMKGPRGSRGSTINAYSRPTSIHRPSQPEVKRRDEVYDDVRKYYPWWDDGGGGPPGCGAVDVLSPSNVGGVYLSGAGKAINGLDQLNGVSIDQNNNLILLGKEDATINLPPLRLDDVVAIFRSVYIYGEGPTVSIDPASDKIDPASDKQEEISMVIRHGKGTEDTYVGWVLYEADRLMKGYSLGKDNKTNQDVTTTVAGYDDILKAIYFGEAGLKNRSKREKWERFWIVPDQARRFEGPRRELTLVDVPLKVKTQKMKWENGQFVNDPKGQSSPGAIKFSDWFTRRYDQIGGERFLMPPPESGITIPVPVFTELRRIALITAIAEKLRDQGIPLPFWMLDYDVKPVPLEKDTPALRVIRSNGAYKSQITGGVQLSPATRTVKDFSEGI